MCKKKRDKKTIKKKSKWIVALYFGGAFLLSIVLWYGAARIIQSYVMNRVHSTSLSLWELQGLFGDSFGAVNALLSAFAFAAMVVTLLLQREDLALQRTDLALQRDEAKTQNQTLKQQRFENTFFNMLNLFQQIVDNLVIFEPGSEIPGLYQKDFKIVGREVFYYIYAEDIRHYQSVKSVINTQGIASYEKAKYIPLLDHYFRYFYTILSYIDSSPLLEKERGMSEQEYKDAEYTLKYQYAKILRATLSRYEIVLLYYNGLSQKGRGKLKPLLEKYCMLNNIDTSLLGFSRENLLKMANKLLTKNEEGAFIYGNSKYDINDKRGFLGLREVCSHYYSGNDYQILLTDSFGNEEKYHYSAFCHTPIEIENAKSTIKGIDDWWKKGE